MVEEIDAMVEASGWSKELIKIEITESAFVANQELLVGELRRFHDRGFDIWLDDFGSEYSTLGLLQELDFDLIKIDMKFMENFTPDGRNYIIVSEIIDMARRLGIATLIEGVETKEQLRMMQVLGCEKIQGYYYNRPNPLTYISERVHNGQGLGFEEAESAAYYEAVGRVNLNEPMAQGDEKGILNVADIMPAGVLELRSGEAYCLRGTDSFLCRLEDWGILDAEEDDTSIRAVACGIPEWIDLARRCTETDKWLNATVSLRAGQSVMVYARRLSGVSYRGAVALVVVLMPELKERRDGIMEK